jgi:hypothetical protein
MPHVRTAVRSRLIVLSAVLALASALGGCVWADWDHDPHWRHHDEHWDGNPYDSGHWGHGRYWNDRDRWNH